MAYGSVAADQITTSVVGSSLGAGNASIMKNRIINGSMTVDQRNAGASVTPTSGGYSLDRWQNQLNQASKFSIQQNAGSVTPPAGFTNYLGCTSLSAYSVGATDYFGIAQNIEGFNVADLGWGTANAQTITLSFWVRSSLTGTFGGAFNNDGASRSYPFTYSIPTANTWTQISITVAGDTSGTWLKTNGIGITVTFGLGAGSTRSGTAGSWASAWYQSATGATSVVGTNGATFYITGVQLEVGSSATGYEYVNYQTSLANCQRYFARLGSGSTGYVFSGTLGDFGVQFPTAMRTTPSVTHLANYSITNPATATYTVTGTALSSGSTGTNGLMVRCTSSGMSAATCIISSDNNIGFSSEL
jgi:hypothetical protein